MGELGRRLKDRQVMTRFNQVGDSPLPALFFERGLSPPCARPSWHAVDICLSHPGLMS
jgi:hypothetical protein